MKNRGKILQQAILMAEDLFPEPGSGSSDRVGTPAIPILISAELRPELCRYREEEDGPWTVKYWAATTDPGEFCLKNPEVYGTEAGTAIVVPGQYRSAYKLDLHAGKYEALCQRNGKIQVYRDGNRDNILDMDTDTIQEGFFGCNIHKAGANSAQVDKWSAGCQVFARSKDFDELIELCHKQIETHPTWAPTFTYTLITEW